jgi:hypothetical protein
VGRGLERVNFFVDGAGWIFQRAPPPPSEGGGGKGGKTLLIEL